MIVCIAEKPSVAKEIADIIGATTKREGFHEGNGYCVTWTYGHLCTLKEPDDYNPADKRWVISSLPILPERFGIKLISNGGAVRQFKVIERLVKQADQVINCGDAGIEGELIQRWVLSKAGCKAPVMRLWISSLTEEAIREGFKSLKPAADYDLLYAAGNSRAVGDWLLGINATRLYTLKFAQGRGVLSIGRVQTPTLALIVNRDLEISNFVPEKYWELKTRYRGVTFSCEKKKFDEIEAAQTDLASCKEFPLVIDDFSRKKGNEAPPKLLDLTSLQVECNKKYGFSAEDTLQITQKLYERKLLTYPRVDTVYLPNDMYPKIEGIMKGMKPYANFTEQVLAGKIPKRKQVFDDAKVTDHHAIIPTGVNPDGLALREKQVYDMVARRFLAAFFPDSIVSNTVAKALVGKLPFKATGKQILEDGWRALYPKKADSKTEDKSAEGDEPDETDRPADSQEMPVFEKGESGPHEPFVQEKQTTPPKPYTEATLLRAMESCGKQIDDEELRDAMKENGIGRPSTRANIIETLFKRKYIEKRRKALCATQVGIDLIRTIQNDLLKSVELTGQWERKLRQIERGEFDARVFIQEMRQMVTDLTREVMSINGQSIIIAEDKYSSKGRAKSSDKASEKSPAAPAKTKEKPKIETAPASEAMTCPKCRAAEVVRGKTAFGCKRYNSGCDFLVRFEQFGKTLTDKQLTALIQKGETPVMAGLVIDGKKQKGKVTLNSKFLPEAAAAEEKPEPSQPAPQPAAPAPQAEVHAPRPLTCPKCGQGDMLRGKAAYGCSRYREGCSFTIPFEVLHRSYQTDRLNPDILQKIAGG